jgi:hypothetical protein
MSSNDTTTTVNTRSVLLSQPTEMQNAYNAFAVAVKNHTANPNPETLQARDDAQAEVYRVEDLYREGRKLRLAHAMDQRDKARRS